MPFLVKRVKIKPTKKQVYYFNVLFCKKCSVLIQKENQSEAVLDFGCIKIWRGWVVRFNGTKNATPP
jgi:hypothetical protein